jgi:hypothetical protein
MKTENSRETAKREKGKQSQRIGTHNPMCLVVVVVVVVGVGVVVVVAAGDARRNIIGDATSQILFKA